MSDKEKNKTLLLAAAITLGTMGLCMTAFWLIGII